MSSADGVPPDGFITHGDGITGMAKVYVTGVGQILRNIHEETETCRTRGCTIHSPTRHAMREFPTHWRDDRGMMERICPHGVGHPDPDYLSFVEETYGSEDAWAEGVHGCDGCCREGGYELLQEAKNVVE